MENNKTAEEEIWRPIEGFEGLYEVSNLGRVKSLGFKTQSGFRKGKILVNAKRSKGYLGVTLCKNSTRKDRRIHSLVATAFIPNPNNKPEVNHINNLKWDNSVSNLEWCTTKENQQHYQQFIKSKHGK